MSAHATPSPTPGAEGTERLLATQTIATFLDALAAPIPVPGGGAVAGLLLAQSAALGEMVVSFALTKSKFAAFAPSHRAVLAALTALRQESLRLADLDASAYRALNTLWRLPKEDAARASGWEIAVEDAIQAPNAVIDTAASVLRQLEPLIGTTAESLKSDLAIAVDLAAAAARAAAWNVRANLPLLENEAERSTRATTLEHALRDIALRSGTLTARL
ncbi:MAG: hypothetical protein EXS10_08450 [Phycisphaerales bacterium]|nr:hypothetical protein [Phycisphaerales bacterium]